MSAPNPIPQIVVISGPPGAGKTTIAKRLAKALESTYVDGDAFFSGPIPPWTREAHGQNTAAVAAIGREARAAASDGRSVVVDGLIGPWFIEDLLRATGTRVAYLILRPDRQTIMRRALDRDAQHLTDPAVVTHMYDAFRDLGEYEGFVVDTTSMTIDETAATIGRRLAEPQHALSLPTNPH